MGFRIQRKTRVDGTSAVYTYPSKDALAAVKAKLKQATEQHTTSYSLETVLVTVNPILRGWAGYFRHGASSGTFSYLGHYSWWRMIYWLRRKHPTLTWKQIRRRCNSPDRICEAGVSLFSPAKMTVERYRYRGAQIATPYNIDEVDPDGAPFRRANRDDRAFVGKVSELVTLT